MKATVTVKTEVDIRYVRICVPVRYEEEVIPNDFPLRNGDMWEATVDIDTGEISDWPKGKSGELYMRVVDSGSYLLIGASGETLAMRNGDYVPHGVVPGEYGDYIDLKINADGIITNWFREPDVSAFFSTEE